MSWIRCSRMLNKSFSVVLPSLRAATYGAEYDLALRSLRPCWKVLLNILQAYCHVIVKQNRFSEPW
jgi:hypothetical protein